jgi:hypothetical protein
MFAVKLRAPSRDEERFCRLMQAAERMRARAWVGYLDSTREAECYDEDEPEAWNRLQERLAAIDQELLHAVGNG